MIRAAGVGLPLLWSVGRQRQLDYQPASIINFVDFDPEREIHVLARTDESCAARREHTSLSKHVCEFTIAKVLIVRMREPAKRRIALWFNETA